MSEVFKLKRSDVKKSDILVPLWVYVCPLCYRQIMSHTVDRVIMYARFHLERAHKLKVVVEE
jgi:hypothetical protein